MVQITVTGISILVLALVYGIIRTIMNRHQDGELHDTEAYTIMGVFIVGFLMIIGGLICEGVEFEELRNDCINGCRSDGYSKGELRFEEGCFCSDPEIQLYGDNQYGG